MSIKKAYQPLAAFIEQNKAQLPEEFVTEAFALMSSRGARNGGNTFIKDTEGNTVGILCYYFKRWMPLAGSQAVEFGAKKNTATGYNTMCKEGTSHWTKQLAAAKKASTTLLDKVAIGEILPDQIKAEKNAIEASRHAIAETDKGFSTKEELVDYLASENIQVAVN